MLKKRLIAMLLALLLVLSSCAALAESMEEYGQMIYNQLTALAAALDSGNLKTANYTLMELRSVVYRAARYLAVNNQYDPHLMNIIGLAENAVKNSSENYKEYINSAIALTASIFNTGQIEDENGYISLASSKAVTLSGHGYTDIAIDVNHNCVEWWLSVTAGTLKKRECKIPFKVYNANHDGNGLKAQCHWKLVHRGGFAVAVYIDEADFAAAEPGTYTGELPYSLAGSYYHEGQPPDDIDADGVISLTLIVPEPTEYSVTVTPQPEEGGVVTGAGSYAQGAAVSLTATPNPGWRFVEWQVVTGNAAVENNQFVMPGGNVALQAVFEMVEYPIYKIETDDFSVARIYDGWLSLDEVKVAIAGELISLSLLEDAEPEAGKYFTGEYVVNEKSLGLEYEEGTVVSWPVQEFIMPACDVTIETVQAYRESVTLDFTQADILTMPYMALVQLRNDEAVMEMGMFTEGENSMEYIDLNGSGVFDIAVAEPDFRVTTDFTLTLLPECDAFGVYTFTFSYNTDRYSPVELILPTLAFGEPDFVLPANLTAIGDNAFTGADMTAVYVPEGCLSIGKEAFKNCGSLTRIRIPADCIIGQDAFAGCGTVYVFSASGSPAEAYCADPTNDNCMFVPEP